MSELKLSSYYQTRADTGTVYPVSVDHNGVTGVIAVTFTEPTHAYVRTEGHVNDDLTILTYRGTEFLVSLHAHRTAYAWERGERVHATRRDNWSDATPTQAKKLSEAMIATLNALADSPEFVAARKYGTLHNAAIDRESAERKVREAKEALKQARAELDAVVKRVNDAVLMGE